MTDITFVRTSHFYDSYQDLLKLVELNDFPIIREYDFDIGKEGVYIFVTMNGDVEAHLTNELNSGKPALWSHRILWNIERPPGSAGIGSEYMRRQWWLIHNRYFDEIWVSDQRLADESELRYVTLGSDERLGEVGTDKRYDFVHISYEVNRRQSIYKYFPAHVIAPNGWGTERHESLKQAKFGVAIHQDWMSFQEPLRLAIFAAYGLPIISEHLYNPYPYNDQTIITATKESIIGIMKKCFTEDYEPYRQMGLRARERMCGEFQFGKVVRQAVLETVNKWR